MRRASQQVQKSFVKFNSTTNTVQVQPPQLPNQLVLQNKGEIQLQSKPLIKSFCIFRRASGARHNQKLVKITFFSFFMQKSWKNEENQQNLCQIWQKMFFFCLQQNDGLGLFESEIMFLRQNCMKRVSIRSAKCITISFTNICQIRTTSLSK